jgi:hypothetical protein
MKLEFGWIKIEDSKGFGAMIRQSTIVNFYAGKMIAIYLWSHALTIKISWIPRKLKKWLKL